MLKPALLIVLAGTPLAACAQSGSNPPAKPPAAEAAPTAPTASAAHDAGAPSSVAPPTGTAGADRSANGAFSAAQASAGETVFVNNCSACHAPSFHTGEQFRFSWFGRTVFDYFKLIKNTMPEDNPGGLTDADYLRVIAYILKLNGFTPGTDSLVSDSLSLKHVRIGERTTAP